MLDAHHRLSCSIMAEAEEIHFKSDNLTLEGELVVPDSPSIAIVIAHPHPQHGGNMRSIIPGALFASLPEYGAACLRFNFRGIGNSEGLFGEGIGERHDLVSAIDTLTDITEGMPLMLAGWSFGADTALCIDDVRITGWFLVAPPLRDSHYADMIAAHDARPKRFCIPQNDQYCPPEEVERKTTGWVNISIDIVGGADHFLVGRTDVVVDHAKHFVDRLVKETIE
jgi:alpha/beta superfamily hydrolase